jgi:hypothetical protein
VDRIVCRDLLEKPVAALRLVRSHSIIFALSALIIQARVTTHSIIFALSALIIQARVTTLAKANSLWSLSHSLLVEQRARRFGMGSRWRRSRRRCPTKTLQRIQGPLNDRTDLEAGEKRLKELQRIRQRTSSMQKADDKRQET